MHVAIQSRQRPHHPAVHLPGLEILPLRLVFGGFRQVFVGGDRQQVQQGADVVRKDPPGLPERFERRRRVLTLHQQESHVVGDLGSHAQHVKLVAQRRIARIERRGRESVHALPEDFLDFQQVCDVDPAFRGFRPEGQPIRDQIARFAQRIGQIQRGGPLQAFVGGEKILQERGEPDLQQRLLPRLVEIPRQILAIDGRTRLGHGDHGHPLPAPVSLQAHVVVENAVGQQHVAPLQIVHDPGRQLVDDRARPAVRRGQIEDSRRHGGDGNQDPQAAHQRAQRLADARVAVLAPLAHHPELARDCTCARRQNQIRRHHQVAHPEEVPRRNRRIEQRCQRRSQHDEAQERLPSRITPRGFLVPQQVHHAPRHHRQGHDQQEARRLGRVGDQIPLVAPAVPDHRRRRLEAAQLDRRVPRQPHAVHDVEQQARHHAQPRAHQHPRAEFRALQHGPHHQHRRQRRKHPERREFRDADPVQQAQQIEPARFARPLVFREQPRGTQQQQEVEGSRKRSRRQNPVRKAGQREQARRQAGQQPGLRFAPRLVRIVGIVDRVAHAHHQGRHQAYPGRAANGAQQTSPKRRLRPRQRRQHAHQQAPQRVQKRGTGIQSQMPHQALGRQARESAATERRPIDPERPRRQPPGYPPEKPRRSRRIVAVVHSLRLHDPARGP